ncbi:hypothetical protein EE612_001632 [Oryza sativa]|nr:hypothetical protein EE612_001632 [Oryza sativa]
MAAAVAAAACHSPARLVVTCSSSATPAPPRRPLRVAVAAPRRVGGRGAGVGGRAGVPPRAQPVGRQALRRRHPALHARRVRHPA